MPYTAMIRNLATMTRNETLVPNSEETKAVIEKIQDEELISKSRIHPIAVLSALKTYAEGRSERGSATWNPIGKIVDALDGAFYMAFGNVEPTGLRILLALDVSGSMRGSAVNGIPGLTARDASAAMALVTASVEDSYEFVGFTSGRRSTFGGRFESDGSLTELAITPRQRLDDAVAAVSGLPFGRTDCAAPMVWAKNKGREFDAIVIYTDNETWAGTIHPSEALQEYRRSTGLATKLIVAGTASNGFSIADPNDPGMLDIVGFDASAPQLMSEFMTGRV